MDTLQKILEEKFVPMTTKISNNKYMSALSKGMMAILPIMMVGAVCTILLNLPVDAYKKFIENIGIAKFLNLGSYVTMDILSIYVTFFLGKSFAEARGQKEQSTTIGIFALMAFFILMPFGTTKQGTKFYEFTYLGSQGMFVGMFAAIVTALIATTIIDKDITIKLPDGVPENVSRNFTSIMPAVVVALVFMVLNFIFTLTPYGNIFNCLYSLLQLPLQFLAGNMVSMVIMVFITQFLWFFGIHGFATIAGIIYPIWIVQFTENTATFAQNGTVPNPINITFFDLSTLGGCGVGIALAILLFFFSKSNKNKAFGKLFLPCTLFNIVEPMIFSMPIMLNTLFIIPFILAPLASIAIAYVAVMVLHILPAPLGIVNLSYIPPFFRGFINFGWGGIILEAVIILVSMAIYYPFFKVCDKQELALENEADKDK